MLTLTSVALQCPCKTLSVEIPDLEANAIQGIQCWRGDEQDSEVLDQGVGILLGETSIEGGAEVMVYTMVDAQGEPIPVLNSAVVIRGESEDDPVRLHFIFSHWMELPGWVRVSTFNEIGESDLSEEAVFL
jgi:CxxC motif-containing protein